MFVSLNYCLFEGLPVHKYNFSVLQEFIHYGSVPMQYNHLKPNYAAYLSSNFPTVIILNYPKGSHCFIFLSRSLKVQCVEFDCI